MTMQSSSNLSMELFLQHRWDIPLLCNYLFLWYKYNRDTFLYQIKWRRKGTNQNLACIYHFQIQCYGYVFPHIKVELNYLLINLFIHFSWKGGARGGSGKSIGKSNFVETRTFWHIFRSFDRLWTFYILALQVIRFT